eukprot:GGOE01046821.1.p1 GENE.GGOE01046821.1~~GGOE01046821.1.p1  ORF type:complete len:588 (-),score=95.63 GGOE01046821.1:705-2468(-)
MQPYFMFPRGWPSITLVPPPYTVDKPGPAMPTTSLSANSPSIPLVPPMPLPQRPHIKSERDQSRTPPLWSPRGIWQSEFVSPLEPQKPPNDGHSPEALTALNLKARGDALMVELQTRRAEREARLAQDIASCFKREQDAIPIGFSLDSTTNPDTKLVAEVKHAERRLLHGREERVRGEIAQEEAVCWQGLQEERRKVALDITMLLEANIRERQALRHVDLQSGEHEMARVRMEEDEADLLAERAAEDAKAKHCSQLRSVLAGCDLQLSRLRRGIGSLESLWQAMGKHTVTFPILFKRSMNDEATERLHIEEQQVQQVVVIANWMLAETSFLHDMQVLVRKERQSRRAVVWTESQYRVLLHEKERIGMGVKLKQVVTGVTAASAELRRKVKAMDAANSSCSIPVGSPALPAIPSLRLAFHGPSDSPAPSHARRSTPSQPAPYVFDYSRYPGSPMPSQLPTVPTPPLAAAQRAHPSGVSDMSSLASSLGFQSDPMTSWVDDAPVPPAHSARGPNGSPDLNFLVHLEAYVTEHVSQYLDAKGQVFEVVNAQVDRRETLISTGLSPIHSLPSSVTRQPPEPASSPPTRTLR